MQATRHSHGTDTIGDSREGSLGAPPTADDGHRRALRKAEARAAIFGGPPEPVRVGHFRLLYPVGAGGMGTVFAASDERLARTVAIKLLHAGDPGRGQARLLREAQALARLTHPNVVAVHEVGAVDGRVYVAMELVQGRTLEAVLDAKEIGWRERVALLVQAGRGLAAAHAAGLVHRDFKPGNVLVGDDGRVRVVDFGLAAAGANPEVDAPGDGGLSPMTGAGRLLGTPGYMSPEQFAQSRVDARSDQFSFCVVLYQAVYGRPPFAAEHMAALVEAVMAGKVQAPPADREVPAWLRALILRGLTTRPDDRFPSMDALLAEIERRMTPRAGRRRAALLSLGLAAGLVAPFVRGPAAPVCDRGEAELRGVWDGPRKREVAAAMRSSGQAYAVDAWRRVEARIDAWAGRWQVAWQATCESAGEAPRESQRTCLLGHVRTLRSLVGSLARIDGEALARAATAAQALPDPSACSDPERLPSRPADPELRARVDAADAALADARQAVLLGRLAAAHEALARGEALAEELGDARLKATAGLVRGQLARRAGDAAGAERRLMDAYFLAVEAGDHALAAELATLLVRVVGAEPRRFDEAVGWERHARVALARLGDPADPTFALELARVSALLARGDVFAAEDALAPVLRASSDAAGPTAAEILLQLGEVRTIGGEYTRAEEAYRDAEGWFAASLGPAHPDVGHARFGLARLAAARGAYGEARRGFEALLSFWTDALGPEHLAVAAVHHALGQVLTQGGEADRAVLHYTRARAIFRAAYGEEHVRTALAACGLALRHLARDDAAYAAEAAPAEASLRRLGHAVDRCALVVPRGRFSAAALPAPPR